MRVVRLLWFACGRPRRASMAGDVSRPWAGPRAGGTKGEQRWLGLLPDFPLGRLIAHTHATCCVFVLSLLS